MIWKRAWVGPAATVLVLLTEELARTRPEDTTVRLPAAESSLWDRKDPAGPPP